MSGALRIFISSTGKDLEEYRKAAIEICNRLGLIPIAMEFFEAMGEGATEGSKLKLNDADGYIGIFAHRYGYVEQGYDLSVTEIEFDYAGQLGLSRLCFLVEESYPWPPDQIDFERQGELKSFKHKIDASVIRTKFTTVDDFKTKLIQAQLEWQKSQNRLVSEIPRLNPHPDGLTPILRPTLMVGRETVISDLKERIGVTLDTEKQDITIIVGWPGVGKTTTAASLANEPDVINTYFGGILWITLGQTGNSFSGLFNCGCQLGVPDINDIQTLEELEARIRAFLYDKHLLLVIDDIWNADDAIPFKQVIGPDCCLLVTTRFKDVAHRLANNPGSDVFELPVLSDEASLHLLRQLAPTVVRMYPKESLGVVQDLEGLPLAIRVAGRLLQKETDLGVDVRRLMVELRETHMILDEAAPDDRFDLDTGTTPTVKLILNHSTERLDVTTRSHFAMLGAFAPKPATFDLEAMKFVWGVEDPIPIVRILVDCGLLEAIPSLGRFQMHAILVMHARSLLEE